MNILITRDAFYIVDKEDRKAEIEVESILIRVHKHDGEVGWEEDILLGDLVIAAGYD